MDQDSARNRPPRRWLRAACFAVGGAAVVIAIGQVYVYCGGT